VVVTHYTNGSSPSQMEQSTLKKELLFQERWQAILRCKEEFLQNQLEDPLQHPFMDQEVAASWIRSRNRGVNPYSVATGSHLDLQKLSEIFEKNQALIEITKSLSHSFKEMILACGYIFYLLDNNGVILMHEGNFENFSTLPEYYSRTGIIANEEAEGTTAHELCLRLKRPVQLLGPEHYCVAFQNSIATAAPIKDDSGDIKAALVLVSQPLLNTPDEDTLRRMGMYSLGLVTSLATAVEMQVELNKTTKSLDNARRTAEMANKELQTTRDKLIAVHSTLNATSAFIDEGIIIVDKEGLIRHINPAGMHMLKLSPEETLNRNISEFLERNSNVMSTAKKGENFTLEEKLYVGGDRWLYQLSIRPVIKQDTQELDSIVLKISPHEKSVAQQNKKVSNPDVYTFEDIVSENKEFIKSLTLARRFASSPENILIIGESGTGKEMYAQAIHNVNRPQGPFMAVNCAAMPKELIGSELFGYEGGSFTGAERSGRPGKIELAHGGTLFLDEIGDMPLELQSVLLRALEDKQIMRVGGSRYKKVDFRLVAATNKNLYKMVKENLFREDLYFRLSVLTIDIPPLRNRGNDALVLSQYFIEKYCQKYDWKSPQISSAAQKKISEYGWPGNVRQLQNAMIYAVNTTQDGLIKPENLPNYIILETCPVKLDESINNKGNVGEMLCLENLEKAAIETALVHSNNYVPQAAEILGISRSTLYRKLKDYNIEY
jgi:transcriptional regulator with PAS, ATPase and Fis domain